MFNFFKKESTSIKSFISNNNKITEEQKKLIIGEERYQRDLKLNELNNKYIEYTQKKYNIIDELMNSDLYSKAINQENIFNEYSHKYVDLCNQLLQILPQTLEYDKEEAKICKLESNFNYCNKYIIDFIKLLEKQEKYYEIINVCKYLLSLEVTEDGTKKGVRGRITKAVSSFNNKFNTNYTYRLDDDLIIDLETGEIMK